MFTDMLKLDLATVEPSMAGPKRPQDRDYAEGRQAGFTVSMDKEFNKGDESPEARARRQRKTRPRQWRRGYRGDHVLHQYLEPERDDRRPACSPATRVAKGFTVEAVGEDLAGARLASGRRLSRELRPAEGLDKVGFNLVGYGCTTCIGNSARCRRRSPKRSAKNDLVAAAVLSGNRNFEGRVNADVRANYLASPPLVVAYALAGSMHDRYR